LFLRTVSIIKSSWYLCLLIVDVQLGYFQEVFLGNPGERSTYPMLFTPKEKGQGLVEYALILVLVVIVVFAVLMILGPMIGNVFSTLNDSLSSVSQ